VLFAVGPFLGLAWTPASAAAALGCVALVSLGSYVVVQTITAAAPG